MQQPICHFTVSFLEPGNHVYHVTLDIDQLPQGRHELSLPVWTPGAYKIEDFSRHLFDLTVKAGQESLEVIHAAKNRWLFETTTEASVHIEYRVYAFEFGVSTSHLDQSHAYFNGAQLFLLIDDYKEIPYYLSLEKPPLWKISTGLDEDHSGLAQFKADNYDILIDSPFEVGTQSITTFEVDNKKHTLAVYGHGNEDLAQLTRDVEKIVLSQRQIFGSLPYNHYTFILHLSDKSTGGLEHLNSTTCGVERFMFRPWKNYKRVLGLLSHEFFHLWNVKRIHPDMLGPFDYNKEVYTHLLWAMEGFTDYYAYLTLRRAQLYSVKDYLHSLSKKLADYEKRPGRFVQSLAESSFDTWIKLYKPDEDSINRTISYYLKGDLVGTCLDLEIRKRTNNQASLDDVLRKLYERYGAKGIGFPESVYQDTVEEVAQSSFQEFFDKYIYGTESIPIDEALRSAGLDIQRQYTKPAQDDEELSANKTTQIPLPWLGIDTKIVDGHRIVISQTYSSGPAATLLNAGDELVALNGYQLHKPEDLTHRLEYDHQVGDTVTVAYFRQGQLQTVSIVLAPKPFDKVTITPVKDPTPLQQNIFETWLQAPWNDGEHATSDPGSSS